MSTTRTTEKVEENEKKMKELMENSKEVKTWADVIDTLMKSTVEEVIASSLKERDNEEKERLIRRKNIIVFELPESKTSEPENRKEEDIKNFVAKAYTRSILTTA